MKKIYVWLIGVSSGFFIETLLLGIYLHFPSYSGGGNAWPALIIPGILLASLLTVLIEDE